MDNSQKTQALLQSKVSDQLKRARQAENRADKVLASERDRARKQDTRRKIQLGGLIIKADLQHLSPAILLGILVEAKNKISGKNNSQIKRIWHELGNENF